MADVIRPPEEGVEALESKEFYPVGAAGGRDGRAGAGR